MVALRLISIMYSNSLDLRLVFHHDLLGFKASTSVLRHRQKTSSSHAISVSASQLIPMLVSHHLGYTYPVNYALCSGVHQLGVFSENCNVAKLQPAQIDRSTNLSIFFDLIKITANDVAHEQHCRIDR